MTTIEYRISKHCPDTIIVQVLPSGVYCLSDFESVENAWEWEQMEAWVQAAQEDGGMTLEQIEEQFKGTLLEYTPAEAMEAVRDGFDWPLELGYIEAA